MGQQFLEALIYGAGGHGKVVADVLERQLEYKVLGFLDDNPELWGKKLFGYKVLGGFHSLTAQGLTRYPIIIAIGNNQARKGIAARLDTLGCSFVRAIHPSAQIARDTQIGLGTVVMANVAINPGSRIGDHAIVNTSATIDHDCIISNFVHISPAAVLAGNIVVQEGAHIGIACSILPGLQIGAHSVVGAGAVVTMNIEAGVTVAGIPAKPIKNE